MYRPFFFLSDSFSEYIICLKNGNAWFQTEFILRPLYGFPRRAKFQYHRLQSQGYLIIIFDSLKKSIFFLEFLLFIVWEFLNRKKQPPQISVFFPIFPILFHLTCIRCVNIHLLFQQCFNLSKMFNMCAVLLWLTCHKKLFVIAECITLVWPTFLIWKVPDKECEQIL